nr:hypothetical protein [Euzebyales bacterium]
MAAMGGDGDAGAATAGHVPIAAHRLLGDGRAVALVRPDATVDWWCAPQVDGTPLLWSLLD